MTLKIGFEMTSHHYVMLTGAELREESRRRNQKEILRCAQNDR